MTRWVYRQVRNSPWLGSAALAAVVGWATPSPAEAQRYGQETVEAPTRVIGRFVVGEAWTEAKQRRDRAVESVIDEFSFYKRPFARSILESRTVICRVIELKIVGDSFSCTCDDYDPFRSSLDGSSGRVTIAGQTYDLRQRVEPDRLTQIFTDKHGRRINEYRLDWSGQILEAAVALHGKELPRPIRFRQTYVRKPAD